MPHTPSPQEVFLALVNGVAEGRWEELPDLYAERTDVVHPFHPLRAAALRTLTADVAPSAETYAAVALAPEGAGGRDVEVVRLALQDPAALAKQRESQGVRDDADRHPNGVIIDISRKRVLLDGEPAGLTYKEFELLQYLVLREGRTIDRHELIDSLWDADDEAPSERGMMDPSMT